MCDSVLVCVCVTVCLGLPFFGDRTVVLGYHVAQNNTLLQYHFNSGIQNIMYLMCRLCFVHVYFVQKSLYFKKIYVVVVVVVVVYLA